MGEIMKIYSKIDDLVGKTPLFEVVNIEKKEKAKISKLVKNEEVFKMRKSPILYVVIPCYNEEEVLEKELKGYKEYKKKVRYKLIPFIW